MFIKLFKHEWRSDIRLFALLSAIALGIGCVSAVILRLLTTYWSDITRSDGLTLLAIAGVIFLFAAYIAIILYGTAIYLIQLIRFYRTRFTDQGYLTFTLPVKTSHILLSSALNIFLWSNISLLVVGASIGIAVCFGPAWTPEIVSNMQMAWETLWAELIPMLDASNVLSIVFCLISATAYGIFVPLFSIVLGATIAKKHKVLAIIGVMYGISVVTEVMIGICSFIYMLITLANYSDSLNATSFISLMYVLFGLILLGITAVAYPLTVHLMKNKLNLP